MKTHVIELGGNEYTLRLNRRAHFRLSAMGYHTFDPDRKIAWMCAMVAAMIDTPKQLFTAEEIFELMDGMSEKEIADMMETVLDAVNSSQPGKPKKKAARKRASGRGSGSTRK